MSAPFGAYQYEIYFQGLTGVLPTLPMAYPELEARAQRVLSPSVWSYVAGGAGDERTQDSNVTAFGRWGLMPRMLVGATERDLSIELWGKRWPAPIFMAPIGVIALCAQDGHGDLATAKAAALTGVPMCASTLVEDPLEAVAAEFGDTPGFFQLYCPTDRDLAESLVHRAEAAGYVGIVVTLDTWIPGWRPRDLATSNFPQLRGKCLANYTSDPVFRKLAGIDEGGDPRDAVMHWARHLRSIVDLGRPGVAAVADRTSADPQRYLPSRGCSARKGLRRRRHLLFQSRRAPGQWRSACHRLSTGGGRSRRRPAGAVRFRGAFRRRRDQGVGVGGQRRWYRSTVCLRTCAGWRGRHRARAAFDTCRG